ncbi:hypothetical protein Cgig2_018484 [Carnegiea gigantea]|uniref:Retrotransposon gag domain-containing protein n=1 Tax=Carnegiea gigantea TaxID=171969 RepID=A0A9Q1JPN2_9CARY|nr:hypothetical protein Cgig2_018484 [Carnegiea gigantea]
MSSVNGVVVRKNVSAIDATSLNGMVCVCVEHCIQFAAAATAHIRILDSTRLDSARLNWLSMILMDLDISLWKSLPVLFMSILYEMSAKRNRSPNFTYSDLQNPLLINPSDGRPCFPCHWRKACRNQKLQNMEKVTRDWIFSQKKLAFEVYSMKQDRISISEYYTKIKCVWEEFDSDNKKSGNCFNFLNGLDDNSGIQRSQILLMTPLPSVETVCAMLHKGQEEKCGQCGNKRHDKDKYWQVIKDGSRNQRFNRPKGGPEKRTTAHVENIFPVRDLTQPPSQHDDTPNVTAPPQPDTPDPRRSTRSSKPLS